MSRFRSWLLGLPIAVLATGLTLAAACGSESAPGVDPTPTSTAASAPASTPPPTPTPEPTLEDRIASTRAVLATIATARITMVDELETGARFFGTTFKSLEADLRAPDSFRMVVDVVAPGLGFVEIEMLGIGDEAYMKFSADAPWTSLPADQVPFNFVGVGVTLGEIIAVMADASTAGRESIDGAETIRVDGSVMSDDLMSLIRDADPGHPVTLSLWIGEADHALRQILIDGRIYDDDGPETRRLLTIMTGVPVDIQLPDIASDP